MLVLRTDHGLGSTSGALVIGWIHLVQGNSLLETITDFCGNPLPADNYYAMWISTEECETQMADTSGCCSRNNPPWFHRELNPPISKDIEFRLCEDEVNSNEDIPFSFVEIYVR